MDWREFIASMVGSLAWPTVVVVLVVVLREQVGSLLGGSLRRLKVGPLEAEWPDVVEHVAVSTARASLPPAALKDDTLDAEFANLERLARSSPREAIAQTSALVFQDLEQRTKARGIQVLVPGSRDPNVLLKSAYRGGLINRETGDALRGLLVLRDLVAQREEQATVERAVDYVVLARSVVYTLSRT